LDDELDVSSVPTTGLTVDGTDIKAYNTVYSD